MAHATPTSALVVKAPEAEALVGDLRERFDATAGLGVPAHITILFPFMPPDAVTPATLQRVQAALNAVAAFPYTLESIGRFEATTYLAPAPAEPFVALTASMTAHFPAFRPYEGLHAGTIPHLTVAHGSVSDAETAEAELAQRLGKFPLVRAECRSVSLLENSSGRWKEMHTFDLPLRP